MIPPEVIVALAILACIIGAMGALIAGLGPLVFGGGRGAGGAVSRDLAIHLVAVLWLVALVGVAAASTLGSL